MQDYSMYTPIRMTKISSDFDSGHKTFFLISSLNYN